MARIRFGLNLPCELRRGRPRISPIWTASSTARRGCSTRCGWSTTSSPAMPSHWHPGDVVEQMRAFVELGVDGFMLVCADFPGLMTLDLLIDEVVPAMRG